MWLGNSRTSRYADGKDLYHASSETQRLLRVLARHRVTLDPLERSFVLPGRLLVAARSAPAAVGASARRVSGEVSRLLLDPVVGPRVRALARRHRLDEGDVARLWARSLFRSSASVGSLPVAVEGSV